MLQLLIDQLCSSPVSPNLCLCLLHSATFSPAASQDAALLEHNFTLSRCTGAATLFGRTQDNGAAAGLGEGRTEGADCGRAAVGRMRCGLLLCAVAVVAQRRFVTLRHQLMALGGQITEHRCHIDILLHRSPYQPAIEHLCQCFHLICTDHRLLNEIDLILHYHCGYLIAFVLHLALPFLDRIEGCPICCGEHQHRCLCAAIIRLRYAIEFLLTRCIPQHYAHILAIDLDLTLQKIHANRLFVVLGKDALAVALDHR